MTVAQLTLPVEAKLPLDPHVHGGWGELDVRYYLAHLNAVERYVGVSVSHRPRLARSPRWRHPRTRR